MQKVCEVQREEYWNKLTHCGTSEGNARSIQRGIATGRRCWSNSPFSCRSPPTLAHTFCSSICRSCCCCCWCCWACWGRLQATTLVLELEAVEDVAEAEVEFDIVLALLQYILPLGDDITYYTVIETIVNYWEIRRFLCVYFSQGYTLSVWQELLLWVPRVWGSRF